MAGLADKLVKMAQCKKFDLSTLNKVLKVPMHFDKLGELLSDLCQHHELTESVKTDGRARLSDTDITTDGFTSPLALYNNHSSTLSPQRMSFVGLLIGPCTMYEYKSQVAIMITFRQNL